MRVSSRSLVSPATTIGINLVAVLAIAIILLAPNITITNAQQQEPLISRPPTAASQNGTRLVEDAEDSFRLQVPEGWIIHDVNNTGSILSKESTQGYGILAQLCPQEQRQQQRAALPNAGSNSSQTFNNCDQSENDIIHIVRYPDLDNRLQVGNNGTTANNNNMTIDNILLYHMQKLEEVGYRGIDIVNSTDTTLNVTDPQTNQTITTVPAKFVEMTYATVSAPNETREGYFILTATNATAPNPGMTKGYSIFYEGTSTAAGAATAATIQKTTTTTTAASVSLAPIIPPAAAAVQQIFDSFELIAAQEVVQDMLAAQSEQAQQQEVVGEEEEEPTSSPLTVDVTSSETEGGRVVAPATFEFEADVAGGTEPYTYSWDFDDDGGSSSEESDDDETISHTFEEAGRYNVRLTVTDSIGQRASDSMEITVEEAPPDEEDEVEAPAADEEEEAPSPPPTIRESPAQGEDAISEDNLHPQQQAQPNSAPPTAPTEKIPAEQPTAQGNNQGGEQGEITIPAPNVTQSIQQNASQNTQEGIPDGGSSSEERSDDDENVDHIFDDAGSHNDGDRTVKDSEDQRVSDSIEDIVEAPLEEPEEEEPQEEEPSTQEIPAEQPTAEEVKPDLSDADNNSGADDLIDVDDLFDVDEFIDDLFVKLGLDN
jgi:PKD repeat protein